MAAEIGERRGIGAVRAGRGGGEGVELVEVESSRIAWVVEESSKHSVARQRVRLQTTLAVRNGRPAHVLV
jgi:hypothetical protein